MIDAVLRLVPALLRHIAGYAELFAAEAASALGGLRVQLLGIAVMLVAGSMMLMLACVWAIAATWDGPHRMQTIAGLCIGFGLATLVGLLIASRAGSGAAPPFERLSREWRHDLGRLAALTSVPQSTGATTAEPGYVD